MRLLPVSAMRTLPAISTATLRGAESDAEGAGPPSPANAALPLPAIVEITPAAVTFRIRLLKVSAM
jgi:hypothetical protein